MQFLDLKVVDKTLGTATPCSGVTESPESVLQIGVCWLFNKFKFNKTKLILLWARFSMENLDWNSEAKTGDVKDKLTCTY